MDGDGIQDDDDDDANGDGIDDDFSRRTGYGRRRHSR